MLLMSDFSKWFRDKYLDWEKTNPSGLQGIVKFSEWLDIPQPTVSSWINGKYEPKDKYLKSLADNLGPEVYEVLKLETPVDYVLPESFRTRMNRAQKDTNKILTERKVTDSTEAMKIAVEVFARFGIRISTAEESEKLSKQ